MLSGAEIFGSVSRSIRPPQPNAIVAPIHPKAMPVILREAESKTWLTAPAEHVLRLQTPLPDDELKIVARGADKEDKAA